MPEQNDMRIIEQLMADYRLAHEECEALITRAESEIRAIAEKTEKLCEKCDARMESVRHRLAGLLRQREKPSRPATTRHGACGLVVKPRLVVYHPDRLIEHILNCGYDDCVRIERSIVDAAIVKRIRRGEAMPGARLLLEECVEVIIRDDLLEDVNHA
jgi:exonuclease VII small subunit